jgi:hypothetical protein
MEPVALSNEKEEEVCAKPLPLPPHRLDLGFWLCLREGLGCKQQPDFKILIFLLKSLEGRDKLTKVRPRKARRNACRKIQLREGRGTEDITFLVLCGVSLCCITDCAVWIKVPRVVLPALR